MVVGSDFLVHAFKKKRGTNHGCKKRSLVVAGCSVVPTVFQLGF